MGTSSIEIPILCRNANPSNGESSKKGPFDPCGDFHSRHTPQTIPSFKLNYAPTMLAIGARPVKPKLKGAAY
jgi:hypothetical protein